MSIQTFNKADMRIRVEIELSASDTRHIRDIRDSGGMAMAYQSFQRITGSRATAPATKIMQVIREL